jgi:hypothetical protein
MEVSVGGKRIIPSPSREKARMRELIFKQFSILIPSPQPSPGREREFVGQQ